jgi:ubiquinone/menaquinone biosynthesis C-methylase UbiE
MSARDPGGSRCGWRAASGPNGLVFAQDVQPEMLAAISRRVQREGLANVRTVLGEDSDSRLPVNQLDAVLLVDVVREIDDRAELFANLADTLKPQGRIGVVDFRLEGGGPGPDAEERVSPDVVRAAAEHAGLRLLRSESFLPYQYFLVFGKRQPGETNDQTVGSSAAATRTFTTSARTKG